MATEPPRRPARDWRGGAGKGGAKAARHTWQKDAAPAPGPRRLSRKTKLGLTFASLLVLCGLIVWLVTLLWPPGPACIVLIGAGYEENLAVPHNLHGRQSLEALAKLAGQSESSWFWSRLFGSGKLRLQHDGPREFGKLDDWDADLDSFDEDTVVIFFAAHGGADGKGAYLVRDDPSARQADGRLYVETILDRLERLPANKNKLLILDATQITACWPLGMLHNDFARQLKALDQRIASIPRLVVLCASDVDQRSWGSEELERTVFSHCVIEGLKGAADQNNNQTVDAEELFDYAHREVERWVRGNRAELQTPMLLPSPDGLARARAINLVVVDQPYERPEVKDAWVKAPHELEEAWEAHEKLKNAVPSPAVYSPHHWREYQDTLLRYEQLVRAGAGAEKADRLRSRLQTLQRTMENARVLPVNPVQNSLALPAALGLSQPQADPGQFDELWQAPAENRTEFWKKLQEHHKVAGRADLRQVLRTRLYDFLLERLIRDPNRKDLEQAADFLKDLDDPTLPRPAELHYLLMLQRHLPWDQSPPDRELLQLSLRVRRQAEQAAFAVRAGVHPYSEQVNPWIRRHIEAGDGHRRQGEDLLFATDQKHRADAGNELDLAAKEYEAAGRAAEIVRTALGLRDEVLSALPYYSAWAAGRRLDGPGQERADTLVKDIQTLWLNTHSLTEKLQAAGLAPSPGRPLADSPSLEDIRKQTEQIKTAFDKLKREFQETCDRLETEARKDTALPGAWHEIEEALTVPAIKQDQRLRLVEDSRRMSRRFLVEMEDRASTAKVAAEKNEREARTAAFRQARLALAFLGDSEPNAKSYQLLLDQGQVSPNGDAWRKPLRGIGEHLGRSLAGLPEEIRKRLQEQNGEPVKALAEADRLARRLDGAAAATLEQNPADEYRRFLMQDLLLWQTERTWLDHWFGEDGKELTRAYFHITGKAYLDAVQLLDAKKQRAQRIGELRKKLDTGELALQGPPEFHWTTERRIGLEYHLQSGEAEVPPGRPVLWVETGKEGNLLQLHDPAEQSRQVRDVGAAPAPALSCQLGSPYLRDSAWSGDGGVKKTELVVQGRYRGQILEARTALHLYAHAEITYHRAPPPPTGAIAVQAEAGVEGSGHLAIVLDCSGSMRAAGGPDRWTQVVNALNDVLRDLPLGLTLSVRIFGQRDNGGRITTLRDPLPWRPAEKEELISRLGKQVPERATPLIEAMYQAKEELARKSGFKTMLVLTDGVDSEFAGNRALNPQALNLGEFLRQEFQESGILVHVIGFQVSDKEKPAAELFQKAIEDRRWRVRGKYRDVGDPRRLSDELRDGLNRELNVTLEHADPTPPASVLKDSELRVSRSDEELSWSRPMLGRYKASIRDQQQNLLINPGDYLRLTLTRNGFQRPEYARSKEAGPVGPDRAVVKDNWLLSVLQNNRNEISGSLEMMMTLEPKTGASQSIETLRQFRPQFVWLEVDQEESGQAPRLVWSELHAYPAPAWALEAPLWPSQARPRLRAWWAGADRPRAEFWEHDPTGREGATGRQGDRATGRRGGSVQVEGQTVHFEIQFEDWPIRPGGLKTQPCLVVRVESPKQHVWVELEQVRFQGQEQHFYPKAGKSTAVFWPVTPAAGESKFRLGFISVDAFKRDAESGGGRTSYAELNRLPEPGRQRRPDAVAPAK